MTMQAWSFTAMEQRDRIRGQQPGQRGRLLIDGIPGEYVGPPAGSGRKRKHGAGSAPCPPTVGSQPDRQPGRDGDQLARRTAAERERVLGVRPLRIEGTVAGEAGRLV